MEVLGSSSFAAEGVTTQPRKLIDAGVLTTWILGLSAGRQLGLPSTADNLREMFAHVTAANDLVLRLERESPTLRIEGMTVAGL